MSNPLINARSARKMSVPRITFQTNLYHQIPGEDPKQITINGSELRSVAESLMDRTVTITSIPSYLDFGWLDASNIGTVILYNTTGTARAVNPTEEEKLADASAIVELVEFGRQLVKPLAMPTILHLGETKQILVRSLGADARIRYMGLPK
jgi:hypothetical protein